MLKNTKVVGVASAIALLTGVAFAPSATAAVNNYPELSATGEAIVAGSNITTVNISDAGKPVEYTVDYVRKGCKVITTLGSVTRTERATTVGSLLSGVVSNKLIPTPSKAGVYMLRSKVANDCAADAGYSNKANMAVEVTVGDEITAEIPVGTEGWENVGGKAVRIFGTALDGVVDKDLGTVRIQASVKGKVVASTYTDSAVTGAFSIVVDSKYLNKKGLTKVTLSLASNKFYWMDQDYIVDRNLAD